MKIECPVCHNEGLQQVRGKSARVQHYQRFENGKRVYLYHKMEVNGSKLMEVNKANYDSILRKVAPPIGFEPCTQWRCLSLHFRFFEIYQNSRLFFKSLITVKYAFFQ